MAAIANEIDRILQAAPTRYSNPAGAAVLLTASAPLFHLTSGGAHAPAAITFTATPIDVAGTVQFNATGGTLTVAGNVATLTFENMPGATASVTASVTENGQTYTSNPVFITKVSDGADGSATTTYTWIKYGDSAAGAGLSDSPTGKKYLGLATNKTTATESTNPADYTWSLMTGENGTDGVPGAPGEDGQTLYTWIAYSDFPDGTNLYQVPTDDTVYIGIAPNKTTATESSNKADYVWSRFKGGQGVPGVGTPGARGAGHFYRAGSIWDDNDANAATPGDNVVDDHVTISNGSTYVYTKRWNGSAWVDIGTVINGALLVTGSVTAAKINSNGLDVRAADGTLILSAGGLNASYAAPGTLNNAISIGANGALSGAGGGAVTIGGLGYTGSLNATANITLVGDANVRVQGNTVVKIAGGTNWNAQAYSKESSPYAFASANVVAGTPAAFFGLNDDPLQDAHFDDIFASWYWEGAGVAYTSINGGLESPITGLVTGDSLLVTYDGNAIRWYVKGALHRVFAIDIAGAPLSFDSSFLSEGSTFTNCQFGPLSNISSGVNALAAVNDPTTGLAQRMRLNADNILGGIISANAVTVPAGVRAGTLTWNNAGARTGGYGVALTPQGLVGYNSSGVLTFSISATTGDAVFGGTLSAATGSFSGNISGSSGTFSGSLTASQVITRDNIVDNAVSTVDIFGAISSGNNGSAFVVPTGGAKVIISGAFGANGGTNSTVQIRREDIINGVPEWAVLAQRVGPVSTTYVMGLTLAAGTYYVYVLTGSAANAYVKKDSK